MGLTCMIHLSSCTCTSRVSLAPSLNVPSTCRGHSMILMALSEPLTHVLRSIPSITVALSPSSMLSHSSRMPRPLSARGCIVVDLSGIQLYTCSGEPCSLCIMMHVRRPCQYVTSTALCHYSLHHTEVVGTFLPRPLWLNLEN